MEKQERKLSKRKASNTLLVLIIFAVTLITPVSPSSLFAEKDPLFPEFIKWHVYVVNGLSNGQNLLATCKSKDDNLGTSNLYPGTNLTWSFRTNFIHSTLFWCSVTKEQDKASATFEVFWYDARLFNECQWKNCIWVARDDGIYLTDLPQNQDELRYTWQQE